MVIPPNASRKQRQELTKYRHMMIRELNAQEIQLKHSIHAFKNIGWIAKDELGLSENDFDTKVFEAELKIIEKHRNEYL